MFRGSYTGIAILQGFRKTHSHVKRQVSIAVLGVLLLTISQSLHLPKALAYSCGNLSTGHCYARATYAANGLEGAATEIFLTHMISSDTNGFVDNEMWFANIRNSNCSAAQICWVEAGYLAQAPLMSSDQYFWADFRPGDSNVNEHFEGPVLSSDYNGTLNVTIEWISTNTFVADLSAPSAFYQGLSTNNRMQVGQNNQAQIGQELAGSGSSDAPTASFTYNQLISTSGSYSYWNGQDVGSPFISYPPYGYWSPNPSPSTNGGTFYTNCC